MLNLEDSLVIKIHKKLAYKKYFKMKVLTLSHRMFILLGILDSPDNNSNWLKNRNLGIGFIIWFLLFSGFTSSIFVFFKLVNINMSDAIYTLLQVSAYGPQAYSIMACYLNAKKFSKVFTTIQRVYDECKATPVS